MDFPDCGERGGGGGGAGTDPTRTGTTASSDVDECLWGCQWRVNPEYRQETTALTFYFDHCALKTIELAHDVV